MPVRAVLRSTRPHAAQVDRIARDVDQVSKTLTVHDVREPIAPLVVDRDESRAELDDRLAAGERPVAEVRYLYATEDEQLYQPVFIRLRDDKDPLECLRSQLEKTRRDVHEH